MDKLNSDTWFTEFHPGAGTALSYEIKQKLHQEQTPYQDIAIYETTCHGNLMVIDGFIMLTSNDNFLYHEMMAHCGLFTHQDPQQVAIIGGGDCGTLREVLKHSSIKHATQVDIDERVTRLAEKYFPELCSSNSDPRATLAFEDGTAWIKNTAPASLDVIIVDSTDPIGPGEGLFTEEFYRNCFNALKEDGLLIQQSESPYYHLALIQSMHQKMRNGGFACSQLFNFPQPCYPSGWWTATLAGKQAHLPSFRKQAVLEKNFSCKYYNEDIHESAQALGNFVAKALQK